MSTLTTPSSTSPARNVKRTGVDCELPSIQEPDCYTHNVKYMEKLMAILEPLKDIHNSIRNIESAVVSLSSNLERWSVIYEKFFAMHSNENTKQLNEDPLMCVKEGGARECLVHDSQNERCNKSRKIPCRSPFMGNLPNQGPSSSMGTERKKTAFSNVPEISNLFEALKNLPSDEALLESKFPTLRDCPSSPEIPKRTSSQKATPSKNTRKKNAKNREASSEQQTSQYRALPVQQATKMRVLKRRVQDHVVQKDDEVGKSDVFSVLLEKVIVSGTYKEYLNLLTPEDRQVCEIIATFEERRTTAFQILGYPQYLSVGDCLCIYPDNKLNNVFIDVYLYHMHLEQNGQLKPKKLYLPLKFQEMVNDVNIRICDKQLDTKLKFSKEILDRFMPIDSGSVEQVYIPLHDRIGGHWFLVVVDIAHSLVYIVDSLGVNERRKTMVEHALQSASICCAGHPRLSVLFENVGFFPTRDIATLHQLNDHDCGMYLIKYIEAEQNDDWKNIIFTTGEMRLERLKYLARLLRSKRNGVIAFKRVISQSTVIKS